MPLTLRPMTPDCFATWDERLVVEYAREKVEAVWTEKHAHMMKRIPQA